MNRRAFSRLLLPMAARAQPARRPRPYLSLFCYPWDVLDEGAAEFARLAGEAGMTHISLASSYHGGKALLPHNRSHRVYFIEDGAIYFQPAARWFEGLKIQPKVSRLAATSDTWKEITQACRARGLGMTAWTVSLHNTYLGATYPAYTTRNVFGDRYPHALCPAQPEVRRYLAAVTRNLAAAGVEYVDFEAFQFIPFRHYSFLEKTGIEVTPFAEQLLSLCFCDACMAGARRAGADGAKIADGVRGWLTRYFDGGRRGAAGTESIAGLNDYLESRFTALEQCFAGASEAAHAGGAKVIYMSFGDGARDVAGGIDLSRIARHADAIEHLFYGRPADALPAVVRNLRRACGERPRIYLVLRPGYPDARSANELIRTTTVALQSAGSGVSFYNFGLFERSHMHWIRQAITAAAG